MQSTTGVKEFTDGGSGSNDVSKNVIDLKLPLRNIPRNVSNTMSLDNRKPKSNLKRFQKR